MGLWWTSRASTPLVGVYVHGEFDSHPSRLSNYLILLLVFLSCSAWSVDHDGQLHLAQANLPVIVDCLSRPRFPPPQHLQHHAIAHVAQGPLRTLEGTQSLPDNRRFHVSPPVGPF